MEDRFEARGITFLMRELEIDDYDELIEKHTTEGDDGEAETFDSAAFTRDLTRQCLIRPKWSDVPKGTRLVRMLEQRALALHTAIEPVKVIKDGEDEDGDEGSEETPQDA